ncbi:unnamed protein product [Thlaspi arvense]|uniref:DUF4283 domain-containing protein n=1 Tax=Thlaspi arvense TaxID=13288 RepID=A0AAU9RE44_THLAR|nr:unnamed protein product [Thlaspi arvense]
MPKQRRRPSKAPPVSKKFLRVLTNSSAERDDSSSVSVFVGGSSDGNSTSAGTNSTTVSLSSLPGVASKPDLLNSSTSGVGPKSDLPFSQVDLPQGILAPVFPLVAAEEISPGTKSQSEQVAITTTSDCIASPSVGVTQPVRKWSSLVQDSAQLQELGSPTQHISGAPFVLIPDENIAAAKQEFKDFIFARFHGDSPEMGRIIGVINAIWTRSGPRIFVHRVGQTSYLLRVTNPKTRDILLSRLVWNIAGFPMFVSQWTQDLDPEQPPITSAIVPVELRNVPYLLFNKESLSRISTAVGKHVSLAPETERKENFEVAKVLVRVDLTRKLPWTVISGFSSGKEVEIAVSYPWLPMKCEACGKFGHEKMSCRPLASGRKLLKSPGPPERIRRLSRPGRAKEMIHKPQSREATKNPGGEGSPSQSIDEITQDKRDVARSTEAQFNGQARVVPNGGTEPEGRVAGAVPVGCLKKNALLTSEKGITSCAGSNGGGTTENKDAEATTSLLKDGDCTAVEQEPPFFLVPHRKSGLHSNPWAVVGDFNQILRVAHHSNDLALNIDVSGINDFSLTLQDAELFEAQSKGLPFSWWNNQDENPIAKKIDHALINQAWSSCFPDAYAEFLAPQQSDHASCLFRVPSA